MQLAAIFPQEWEDRMIHFLDKVFRLVVQRRDYLPIKVGHVPPESTLRCHQGHVCQIYLTGSDVCRVAAGPGDKEEGGKERDRLRRKDRGLHDPASRKRRRE
jgi:hypothetical protein